MALDPVDECAAQLDLGAHEMSSLVPHRIPNDMHRRLVKCDLNFPSHIAVYGAIMVKVKIAQWCPEAALPMLGGGKDGICVAKTVAHSSSRVRRPQSNRSHNTERVRVTRDPSAASHSNLEIQAVPGC